MIKNKISIENVQRRATRLIQSRLCKLVYYETLKILKLSTLEYRRMRGCMTEKYKILNYDYDVTATEGMFTINERNSRGNLCKLMTSLEVVCEVASSL